MMLDDLHDGRMIHLGVGFCACLVSFSPTETTSFYKKTLSVNIVNINLTMQTCLSCVDNGWLKQPSNHADLRRFHSIEVGTNRNSRSSLTAPGQSLMAWAENLGYFNSSMSPGSKAGAWYRLVGVQRLSACSRSPAMIVLLDVGVLSAYRTWNTWVFWM